MAVTKRLSEDKMLLVQEYLKTKSFGDLAREHGVYASFAKSGYKWSLNYDQIEARESDPLAQECRGLILSSMDGSSFAPQAKIVNDRLNYDDIIPGETAVLAYPMKRFFNFGQGAAVSIDWNDPSVAVMEKLDGTLTIVYFDKFKNDWCVATRSVSEADLPLDGAKFTFRTLFEKALKDTCGLEFNDFTNQLNKHITYCFELCTPYNRVVVNYQECRITLLAARSINSLIEMVLTDIWPTKQFVNGTTFNKPFDLAGVPLVKTFNFSDIHGVIDWVSNQNPLEYEGVVVRDGNFNRIKVKNAAYVAFSKARDVLGTSDRNCLELILAEKDDDVIPALPQEIVNNLLKIKEGYRVWLEKQQNLYIQILGEANAIMPNDKKTFALTLQKHKVSYPGAFFTMFDGKASNLKDYVNKARKDGTWANSFLDKILESIEINTSNIITITEYYTK